MTVVRGESGTGTSKLARAFPWVTGLLGLLAAVSAAMHTVLSIQKAYRERGGYDSRLSEMLWIGWTSFVLGVIMVLGARGLQRRSASAFWMCTGADAVFLVCTVILAPVQRGFYAGLPIYGGYLLLATLVRAEVTRTLRPVTLGRRRRRGPVCDLAATSASTRTNWNPHRSETAEHP